MECAHAPHQPQSPAAPPQPSALRKVKFRRHRPVRGCSPSASGSTPWRPRTSSFWIGGIVAVSTAIGHPTDAAAVGHRNGHSVAARRYHVPEWCYIGDLPHRFDDGDRFSGGRESAKKHCAFRQCLGSRPRAANVTQEIVHHFNILFHFPS